MLRGHSSCMLFWPQCMNFLGIQVFCVSVALAYIPLIEDCFPRLILSTLRYWTTPSSLCPSPSQTQRVRPPGPRSTTSPACMGHSPSPPSAWTRCITPWSARAAPHWTTTSWPTPQGWSSPAAAQTAAGRCTCVPFLTWTLPTSGSVSARLIRQ